MYLWQEYRRADTDSGSGSYQGIAFRRAARFGIEGAP
jgi:hypothetical protein